MHWSKEVYQQLLKKYKCHKVFEISELDPNYIEFPNPESAPKAGLLAYGGDLKPERLIKAYSLGIFPWFNEDEPILWWSPDPRFTLLPRDLIIHKSMKPLFNRSSFHVTFDHDFEAIINNCGAIKRTGQQGTWITDEMKTAYIQLHNEGYAHSVEVWQGNRIVGGLYGVALGKIFFGESMFSKVANASKYGFITLVRFLQQNQFQLIDCQQETLHLASLGAKPMDRSIFLKYLHENVHLKDNINNWENQ